MLEVVEALSKLQMPFKLDRAEIVKSFVLLLYDLEHQLTLAAFGLQLLRKFPKQSMATLRQRTVGGISRFRSTRTRTHRTHCALGRRPGNRSCCRGQA